MKIKINNDGIFQCPEGCYTAALEAADEPKKRAKKHCQEQIRFRYRVEAPDGREFLVGKTYCAELFSGSELYNDLESWTEGNFDEYLDDDGLIDFDLFIGKKADLVITHFKDGQHDKPYVKIAGIFPAGKLTQS